MKFKILCSVLMISGLFGCTTNSKSPAQSQTSQPQSQAIRHSGGGTLIIKPIGFKEDAYIRDAIKKECNLAAKLTQNGQKLGSFIARRYSGSGMFAMYKGTCAILGRCVRTLGKDVATWLSHPTSNAALGNL